MSFGYSAGDFVSLLELTNRVRKRFVRAPIEFTEISEDVKKLGVVLQDIDDIESEEGLNPRQKASISQISQACHEVFRELEDMLDEYQELGHDKGTLGKKTRRVWKRLQWDQSKINDFRKRIDSYMILFSNVIATLNGNVILAVKEGVDRLCQQQADKQKQVILEWLTATDYTARQNDNLSQRAEGTGQWVLKRDEFKSWLSTMQQTLFCLGIPGAGKTTLASIIIDHLEQKFGAEFNVGIAYIYCNFQSASDSSIQDLLASLLKQLIQRRPELPKTVLDMYKNHRERNTRPRTDDLSSCLRSMAAELSTAFIIVDALDECGDSGLCKELLHEIFTLQAECNISFLATSRHIPEIMAEFDRKTWLEIRAHTKDVKRYLRSHLSTFPSFLLQNQDLINEIITTITESVDGMFLLAKLHLNSLRGKSSPKAIRTALRKLHTGSDAYDYAYKDAMERIEQQGTEKRDFAKNILAWITCAKRQLKINELLYAVAVEIGLPYLDEDNLSDMQYMISVCAGLVAVDEKSGIIRLIHYTTQEYFERTWKIWFPEAHRNIAMVSLTYLSFEQFATGPCEDWEEYRDRLEGNPVYEYAARYWGYHAKEAYSEVKDLVDRFFQCDSALASAAQVLSLRRASRSRTLTAQEGVSGLHLAAWFGLEDKADELLQDPGYHDAADNKGQTALHWATRNVQALTVELLIRGGFNINVADKNGTTALHYAAGQGDRQLIQLLVRNGAHLDVVDNDGWTPFLTAADSVNIASIEELLCYDTAIQAVNWKNQNALHLAILATKDESARLVGMLLSHGVCPTLCDIENMTPLHYAVRNGNRKIVQLFLEAGVDINFGIARKRWSEPTKAGRSFQAFDQPLERIETNIQDAAGLTPLHFAVCAGDITMTEYLLDKGANPNVRCSEGDTPLHIALRRGLLSDQYEDAWTDVGWEVESFKPAISEYEDEHADEVYQFIDEIRLGVIKMLLSRTDIDVNIQNVHLDSPLHTMSIFYGEPYSETIVAQLLQKGADPLKRNKKGQTALHFACKAGNLGAVTRFLDAGCSITIEDAEGLTALHYAVRANKYELVKSILDCYKNTAPSLCLATDKQGRTLLHHHLQSHLCFRVYMITVLLDHGVNVNGIDMNGDSPLSIYLRSFKLGDRTNICHLLLQHGADPLWTDNRGQTLAHVTMHNWIVEVEVLELLKEYGVDLNMKDKSAKSILHHGAIHGSISEELICVLQKYNIDGLDERDLEDKSPLIYAAEAANKERHWGTFKSDRWKETWENLKQMQSHKLVQGDSRGQLGKTNWKREFTGPTFTVNKRKFITTILTSALACYALLIEHLLSFLDQFLHTSMASPFHWPGGVPPEIRLDPNGDITPDEANEDAKGWLLFVTERWVPREAANIPDRDGDYEVRQRRTLVETWAKADQELRDVGKTKKFRKKKGHTLVAALCIDHSPTAI
ncbi:hypothetical protein EYB26_004101 [Talaromyces marneffei]|uniref:uncharacterized protein n=1 Tax=Talaromyces marneffei TaxID=37727 RepID=UPI0012A7818E|nr:uncharacterized protein EYB26_004101 [Talaromyces marneffei]QGA16434.1 hypothetical protein EYB26_004101 [Talaromyces marneffei]